MNAIGTAIVVGVLSFGVIYGAAASYKHKRTIDVRPVQIPTCPLESEAGTIIRALDADTLHPIDVLHPARKRGCVWA